MVEWGQDLRYVVFLLKFKTLFVFFLISGNVYILRINVGEKVRQLVRGAGAQRVFRLKTIIFDSQDIVSFESFEKIKRFQRTILRNRIYFTSPNIACTPW